MATAFFSRKHFEQISEENKKNGDTKNPADIVIDDEGKSWIATAISHDNTLDPRLAKKFDDYKPVAATMKDDFFRLAHADSYGVSDIAYMYVSRNTGVVTEEPTFTSLMASSENSDSVKSFLPKSSDDPALSAAFDRLAKVKGYDTELLTLHGTRHNDSAPTAPPLYWATSKRGLGN